jgi:outer membrane lipoprotein-sorting protein
MNLIISLISASLLLFSVSQNNQITENPGSKILNDISLKFQDGYIFEADMSHEFVDAFTQDTVYTRGKIWIGKNKYKIITINQEISVDGFVSTVYNRDQNKVIISNYYPEEDDFAPSRFLGNVTDSFTIIEDKPKSDGFRSIILRANDMFEMITEATIVIFEQDLLPVQIFAEDQSDNKYSTRFNSGRFIQYDNAFFKVNWPSTAEIIDLRED